ncbi:MAG TPA: tol-pal system protein YbgF [Bradyrhizobium sp.]|uniref:tol-pal system protein YbgF n=1 Tax=Bradyrhizobium sp. TaxID=376 RepID=UPI002D05FA01|nr:tol-pal system protein YbgF [Bradyrhizobium sp.]HLZ04039.1 tol-pal system protein YbgF [Bradyrhizobium sp.]
MSSNFLKLTGAAAIAALVFLSSQAFAQSDDADPEMRIQKLEEQLRQLTGQNEELQHRNQLLEQQLRQLGANPQPAQGQQPSVAASPPAQTAPSYNQQPAQAGYQPGYQGGYTQPGYGQQPQPGYSRPQQGYPQQQAYPSQGYPQQQIATTPAPIVEPASRGGRGDAFDPTQNPNAPGAPQALGGGRMPIQADGSGAVPDGRVPGAPLDLSNGANIQAGLPPQQGAPPPPPPRNPNGTGGGLVTAPPTNSPRDEYDLGIGYMQRKDYALAEDTMKNFAQKYPNDPLVGDSQYWLGESYFQRQQYRDAAEVFLNVTSKYDKATKAPDALLRLGQSLAALKEKEAACAAFGEVMRKYPRAAAGVKAAVDREQKRVKC